ncbi:MAG TPA: 50S ribosomal protein L3 [Syntrophobacteraceae bacterium]|nr:50S ribosomal protein L3 [Syntrophobacteraceae bacterium]HBZ56288.1 50S ribosomal protein L3 [Syntrophobacteraceae bacterium]
MIKLIIGRKLGMMQVFADDGTVVPVTVLQAGPCTITQVKTPQRDGYGAVQMGFGTRKAKHINRPLRGHLDKVGKGYFEILREVRVSDPDDHQAGEEIQADIFEIGERVDIIGVSKGKGFAGTIKRWGFHRGPVTHGCKNIREPGSTGCATYPGRVMKGKRMPGQLGNKRVTTMNLKVVDINHDDSLLLIKGAVPGPSNGLVLIRKTNRVR